MVDEYAYWKHSLVPSGFRMLVKMGSKMQNLPWKALYLPGVEIKCTKDVSLHHFTWFLNIFLIFSFIFPTI